MEIEETAKTAMPTYYLQVNKYDDKKLFIVASKNNLALIFY